MCELATERLTLRPLQLSDLDAMMALAADFRVARMLSDMPHPATPAAMRHWLVQRRGERRFVVLRDGVAIGSAGYFLAGRRTAEIGYWLGPTFWGQGYAVEAVARLLDFGCEHDGIRHYTASFFLDNPGSGKVLSRLGFTNVGRTAIYCPARGAKVEAVLCRLDVAPTAGGAATVWGRLWRMIVTCTRVIKVRRCAKLKS